MSQYHSTKKQLAHLKPDSSIKLTTICIRTQSIHIQVITDNGTNS